MIYASDKKPQENLIKKISMSSMYATVFSPGLLDNSGSHTLSFISI